MKLMILLMLSSVVQADTIENMIRKEAVRQGIDPSLAVAVAKTESGLNPKARGKAGEIGLFQIMPYDEDGEPLWDTANNVRAGITRLSYFKKYCPMQEGTTWVVCYNNGMRHPKHPRLHPYFKKVMANL